MSFRRTLVLLITLGVSLAGCSKREPFLYDERSGSPILEVAVPRNGAQCASRQLRLTAGTSLSRVEVCDTDGCLLVDPARLTFRNRANQAVPLDALRLGAGGVSEGPVTPVEGPDGLLWLCREDDAAQQCICIPWFQD